MSGKVTIGVLALQGAFAKHSAMLKEKLKVHAIEIRYAEDLVHCDGLIIPGGESTVMIKLLHERGLIEPILLFSHNKPLFGTCAGAILLSRTQSPIGVMDFTVERNAYGRQNESFSTELDLLPSKQKIPGIFIRAPRISSLEHEVTPLAFFNNEPVLVQQGKHIAATFHPELSDNTAVHEVFLHHIVKEKVNAA